MIPSWLALFDGLLAIVVAVAGVVAAHYALTSAIFGLSLVFGGGLLALIGIVVGIIGLIRTASPVRRSGRPRAVIGLVLSLIVVAPLLAIFVTHRQYPPINDITTDTANPPQFVKAQDIAANHGRDMSYNASKYEAAQTSALAYKNLAPLKLDTPPDDAFKKAEVIAGEIPNWKITYSDSAKRILEGTASSALFHFQDDWVIQVRDGEGGGSLIEMRSKSRDGVGDLGVNYHRIESFFHLMEGAPRGAAAGSDSPP